MNYFVYIIYSKSKDRYYIGYTHDLHLRLLHHNDGWTKSTKAGIPWKLTYYEEFLEKSDAIKREKQIKHMKSRDYIQNLITNTEQ